MTHTIVSAALVVALLGSTTMAQGEQRHHNMSGGAHFGDFRGRNFGNDTFREPAFHGDRDTWRNGRWRHDWHDGRLGWWWVVGDDWLFYPEPIYPYPAYAYDEPAPTAGGAWYYCTRPQGYYPYVRHCDSPWEEVPAAPQ